MTQTPLHMMASRVMALAAVVLLVHGSYVMYNRRPELVNPQHLERHGRQLTSMSELTDEDITTAGFASEVFADIAKGWVPPVVGGGARSLLAKDEFYCLYPGLGASGYGYTLTAPGYTYGYGYKTSTGYGSTYGYGYCPPKTSVSPSGSGSILPSSSKIGSSGSMGPSGSVSPSKSPFGSLVVSSNVISNRTGTPMAVAYAMGGWSKCDKLCNGGLRTALVTCQNQDSYVANKIVPLVDCEAAALPKDLQSLIIVPKDAKTSTVYILKQACNPQVCPPFMYKVGTWTPCSATCDGGNQTRAVACIIPDTGAVAPSGSCSSLEGDTRTSQACNTAPCNKHYWSVSAWVGCSASECGGSRTRTVECRASTGAAVAADLCKSLAKPSVTDACEPCNLCNDLKACSGAGTCTNSICKCNSGFMGASCSQAVPTGCVGTQIDEEGKCCDVIDANTKLCCAAGAKLDSTGACCTGTVDGCRMCNGQGIGYDIKGNCCSGTTAKLTPARACCKSGIIDECGLCDGDSSSCKLKMSVKMSLSPAAALKTDPELAGQMVIYFADSVLRTQRGRCSVTLDRSSSRRRLAQSGNAATVNVVVSPSTPAQAAEQGMTGTITTADASDLLAAALLGGGDPMFSITDILDISRSPVCGNDICETGELLAAVDLQKTTIQLVSEGKCRADCPYVLMTCSKPGTSVGDSTVDCGGNGFCQLATGDCSCDKGYSGFSCGFCQVGFAPSASRTCQQLIARASVAPTPAPPKTTDLSTTGTIAIVRPKKSSSSKNLKVILPAVLVPCGVVIILGVIAAFMYAKKVQRTAVVGPPSNVGGGNGRADDLESSNRLAAPAAAQTTSNPVQTARVAVAAAPPPAASGADLFMPVPTFLSDKEGGK